MFSRRLPEVQFGMQAVDILVLLVNSLYSNVPHMQLVDKQKAHIVSQPLICLTAVNESEHCWENFS